MLAPQKKSYDKHSVLKSRDITLPTKVCLIKAMVFPVIMYGCGSWTIKKSECQRTDAFELWCWRRLLRVPRTARRSNLSIPKKSTLSIHQNDWCWSWSSNTLKTLILGKIEGKRRRRWQRMRWLDSITDSMDMNLSKLREILEDRGAWHAIVQKVAKSRTWLSNWTTVFKHSLTI